MKTDFNSSVDSVEIGLDRLKPGTLAEVVSVDVSDATGRRLQDLGMLPRTPIRALRRAPLGDPGLYELRGYRLCLRDSDAQRVRVRVSRGGRVESADPTRRARLDPDSRSIARAPHR